ncbi:hypothetical protein CYME_CMM295C [Cyanidioschyzon merolae strain 10D]|uniref:Uncharacterized protein n=1 Tax=Cyanidioschyzon merolae (strain NIES-3377 / 10D) TaxID=280699 RepID=M1VE12_CYAM1|nr:hypothetical protein CYME_CMM295C [Cyanidioschyzon merolae strain 10D]BAM81122.1 hypothetical protein CYME_CMM295C [Cyanidioschyzon merolae strain 10D]|eukprot:XP_005537158.1 hypothetical protein CYME_CMM295C [Cyanidioschyzon merolae strain 10D]
MLTWLRESGSLSPGGVRRGATGAVAGDRRQGAETNDPKPPMERTSGDWRSFGTGCGTVGDSRDTRTRCAIRVPCSSVSGCRRPGCITRVRNVNRRMQAAASKRHWQDEAVAKPLGRRRVDASIRFPGILERYGSSNQGFHTIDWRFSAMLALAQSPCVEKMLSLRRFQGQSPVANIVFFRLNTCLAVTGISSQDESSRYPGKRGPPPRISYFLDRIPVSQSLAYRVKTNLAGILASVDLHREYRIF